MILVGRYRSPFVRRVAVTLRLYDMPFERRVISVWDDLPEVREYNPLGRVPALILDDGEVLVDSSAIIDHLDDAAGPERALTPAPGAERRRVQRLVALALGVLEKAAQLIYEHNARPPEKYHQPWIDRCRGQVTSGLAALDDVEPGPWLTGDRLTQADVTAGVAGFFIRLTNSELLPEGRYPNLEALMKRCAALPAFKETEPEAA